jgi:Tat protein translocase TatB subunit
VNLKIGFMLGSPVLLFLDISGGELLVIMLVVFLVFGPEKMPDMARKAGKLMNQMKKASSDLTREFKKETSSIQTEINAAHTKVDEQLESVRRELNRTKAQVVNDMSMDQNPKSSNETEVPDEKPLSENKTTDTKQKTASEPKISE